MKILCFSINPLYPELITGGASKHLTRLSHHLTVKGHEVTILCAEDPKGQAPFELGHNIRVEPLLHFHQPFPQPYAIAPGELALIYDTVSRFLSDADRFYIHDGELLLPRNFTQVPVITSFRDNIYPESVLGSFLTQADGIIAVSEYSAEVLKASAGRMLAGLSKRVQVIPNGIDPAVFSPAGTQPIRAKLGLSDDDWPIVLHPHRPEAGKGLASTLAVAELLVYKYGFDRLKVLAPNWVESMEGHQEDAFYQEIHRQIATRGLNDHVLLHPWLSQAEMAGYYSLGDVNLCLGEFVEAFGNVAYESQVCGTPAIVSRSGTHRTQLPDDLIFKVDPGDITQAAELAAEIIKGRKRVSQDAREEILRRFSLEKQLLSYESIISGCEKRAPLNYQQPGWQKGGSFKLAPWCFMTQGRIYHDYKNRYFTARDIEGLDQLVMALGNSGSTDGEELPGQLLARCQAESLVVPVD